MAEKVPGWLGRVLLPQLSEMKGELKAMGGRIDGEFIAVHSEIRAVEEKMGTKIEEADRRLGSKIDEVDKRLSSKIDELDRRLDVTQRLAVVEEQVKELLARN